MRSSYEVGPKRAPLGNHKPRLPAQPPDNSSMRRAAASAQRPPAAHETGSENSMNRKTSKEDISKVKQVRFGHPTKQGHAVRNMEDTTSSTAASASTMAAATTTPSRASSRQINLSNIRQSLRETISPLAAKPRQQTPARSLVASVPKKYNDMTPRTLLRDEMDETDVYYEESLLFSPASLAKKPVSIRIPLQEPLYQSQIGEHAASRAHSIKRPSHEAAETDEELEVSSSDPHPLTARVDKGMAASTKRALLQSGPEFAASAIAAHRAPRTSNSPLTGTKALCMDLSGMFRDAASTSRPPPKPQQALTKLQTRLMSAHKQKPVAVQYVSRKSNAIIDSKPTPLQRARAPKPPVPMDVTLLQSNEDDWAKKQGETFMNWLNFIMLPSEGEDDVVGIEEGDPSALRNLSMHRRLAQARLKASEVYKSKKLANIRTAIYGEITKGKLALRNDKELHADLTLQRQVLSLLLSYSVPYLRVCLETMFDTVIDPLAITDDPPIRQKLGYKGPIRPVTPMSRTKLALKQFLVSNVFSDSKILAKYTKKNCKVPSGRFGVEYQAEMQKVILFRLVVLFVYLDQCKEANIIDKASTLFEDSAPIKSSREVLLSFSREFLSAEGDFVKHLARIGIKVSYVQNPIDELDFIVTNLAVDLRDGVKLARVVEILQGVPRTTILSSLRLPAVSRLQKLHNVGLAITSLRAMGVHIPIEIMAHHVIDGHREVVLKLIWLIVAHHCIRDLVDLDALSDEISRIERLNALRGMAVYAQEPSLLDAAYSFDEQLLRSMLLRWSNAICNRFQIALRDLTGDFADGKAVCILIHYYQPTILRLHEIKNTTRDLPMACRLLPDVVENARANERFNASLANSRLAELGGIPNMVPSCDTSFVPEEKSVLICLAFMFSRLHESRGEVRAAIMIQRSYQNYRCANEAKRKTEAALLISQYWYGHKDAYYANMRRKYLSAVRKIECFVYAHWSVMSRMKTNRVALRRIHAAAVLIQRCLRGSLARIVSNGLLHRHRAAVLWQTHWRRFVLQQRYTAMVRHNMAALSIQGGWISYRNHQRNRHAAAMLIERIFRGYFARLMYALAYTDVVFVQSCARRLIAAKINRRRLWASLVITRSVKACITRQRSRADILRTTAAVVIQSMARMLFARRVWAHLNADRQASVSIQSMARGYLTRQYIARQHVACQILQAQVRMMNDFRRYCHFRSSILSLQTAWRSSASFKNYQTTVKRLVKCQAVARRHLGRTKLIRLIAQRDSACVKLQSNIRQCLARNTFTRTLTNVKMIQNVWKMLIARKGYSEWRSSLVICQKTVRSWLAMRRAARRSAAVIEIQSGSRMLLGKRQRVLLADEKIKKAAAAVTLQKSWRGMMALIDYRITWYSLVTIQSLARGLRARKDATARRMAVVTLHSSARCFLARVALYRSKTMKANKEKQRQSSAVIVQSTFRGYLLRRELACLSFSAIQIQRTFRGFLAFTTYQLGIASIIRVQSCLRMVLAQRRASFLEETVLCAQSYVRRFIAVQTAKTMRRVKVQEFMEDQAAKFVQRVYRGHRGRYVYKMQSAARKIQKTWRCYTVHVDFLLSILAAIDIQTYVRRHLSIILYENRLDAVYTLQAFATYSLRRIRATQTISRYARGYMARERLRTYSMSANTIQRIWRGHVIFSEFKCLQWSAVRLQAAIRGSLAKTRFKDMKIAFAASTIQRTFRLFAACCRNKRQRLGLIRFQGLVRAHYVRRVVREEPLRIVAKRVVQANKNAESDPSLRLDNRCAAALRTLQRSTRLAQLTSAIKTLETATRLSEVCCRLFVAAGASEILLRYIPECNRSVPHIEILTYALRTLTNVACYNYLLHSLATDSAVAIFIGLAQMFREREPIFTLTAALLEQVVFFDRSLLAICKGSENSKRLNGIVALWQNKASGKVRTVHPADSHHFFRSSTSPAPGIQSLMQILGEISKM